MSDIRAADASTLTDWRAGVIVDFARSELFEKTFQEGMELVEETAAYLDGGGRSDARLLSRGGALAYASESMRLTTRLMQLASWLLVQRAVREGDMPPIKACDTRYRLAEESPAAAGDGGDELPAALLQLLDRSSRLYERVSRLDHRMYVDGKAQAPHPVLAQFDRLTSAFTAN